MIDRPPNPSILSHLFGGEGLKPAQPLPGNIEEMIDAMLMPRIVSRTELPHGGDK
jgi:hypothetical protein